MFFVFCCCCCYKLYTDFVGSYRPKLKDLVCELKEVDWNQLGIQLDVPSHILRNIDRENPGNESRKLSAVLDYWIKNAKPAASWKMIVKALQRIEGHKNIITNIQSKYIPPSISQSISCTIVPTLLVAEEDVSYVIDGVVSLVIELVRLPSELHDLLCADAHLVELSNYIVAYGKWEELAPFLHLSSQEVKTIASSSMTTQSLSAADRCTEILRKWKSKGKNADYR